MFDRYEIYNFKNAIAILQVSFPSELAEIDYVLNNFQLSRNDILAPGGRKSPIAEKLDGTFYRHGWEEKLFQTSRVIDGHESVTPTHKVDCYKNRVAVEVEWNNKDPFYDRDLNNFRLLYDLEAIAVGVIITRADGLQNIFNNLGKGKSYGASTTHMSKLIPKILGGGAGGCPVLVLGITERCYQE